MTSADAGLDWRCVSVRDPVVLRWTDGAPPWFPRSAEVRARVVSVLGVEHDAPMVVQLATPSAVGFGDDVGLHLALPDDQTDWPNAGVVQVRRFRFPDEWPAPRDGTAGDAIEGLLHYARLPFDLAAVHAEADTARGSRLINGQELAALVDYASQRDSAVTFVETYELRGVFQYARPDVSLYGLDPEDELLARADLIAETRRRVTEMLALAQAEDSRFGFQVWVG